MEEADVESARGRFSKRPCHKPGVSLSPTIFLFSQVRRVWRQPARASIAAAPRSKHASDQS